MKISNKICFTLLIISLMLFAAGAISADESVHHITMSNGTAELDGAAVPEYDYAWHADPSTVHDEVKDGPAEYYTGTEPEGGQAVYIAHDIFYFPEVPAENFKKVRYDGDTEWAYYYTAEGYREYIWALLPVRGSSVPTEMMHSEEDAWNNPVLHITKAGTYELSGTWHGQIWIDLGNQDDTFSDENAKVTLILNGADVTCDVAPALVFYSVYEADNEWEERDTYGPEVDISDAGAHIVIADDSENNFSGTNVYRMLKAKFKDDESTNAVKVQKKMRKTDGAFYSYRSMLIDGGEKENGVLNITAAYEGLDTELHLTLNGGKVNIMSQDDGMNVNEDGVSVVTVNGGELHIVAGLGMEGDGLDSNGYLVINGGIVISAAKPQSDSGLDSDKGSYVNGGYVVATGSTMDWAESNSRQVTMNLQFASQQASNEAIIVTDTEGKVLFAYDPDKDETTGANNRGYSGAVISSPAFKVGETYNVYVGGDVEGTETDGLYDIETVTGFSDSVRQVYTGTDVRGFGPGRNGGFGEPPEGMFGERPERPDRFPGGEPPEGMPGGGFPGGPGGRPGERPDGRDGIPGGPMREFENIEGLTVNEDSSISVSESAAAEILAIIQKIDPETTVTAEEIAAITDMREIFDLMRPGGRSPDEPGGPGDGRASTDFYMNDTVNSFSGVTDETAE